MRQVFYLGSTAGPDRNDIEVLIALSIFTIADDHDLILAFQHITPLIPQGAQYNQRFQQNDLDHLLVMLALTISITAQIVGALLIFGLLTIPSFGDKILRPSTLPDDRFKFRLPF